MEVLDTLWANGPIGIVKAKNEAGDVHIYIGIGIGENEQTDINRILDWGSKYKLEEFKQFLK